MAIFRPEPQPLYQEFASEKMNEKEKKRTFGILSKNGKNRDKRFNLKNGLNNGKKTRVIMVQTEDLQSPDGLILEGEEDQKSMSTLLETTGITKYAPNHSDVLFMVIEMVSPRLFLILFQASRNLKQIFLLISRVQNKNLGIVPVTPFKFHISKSFFGHIGVAL